MSRQLLLVSPSPAAIFSFVPHAGTGNVNSHGDSSVNRDFLGISATLAHQWKCLVLDSFLIRGPSVTPGSFETRCSLLCFGSFLHQSVLLDGLRCLMHWLFGPFIEPSSLLGTKEKTVGVVLASIVYFLIVADTFSIYFSLNTYKYKVLVTILFVSFLHYLFSLVWPF